MEVGIVPHTSVGTEVQWSKCDGRGWLFGWTLRPVRPVTTLAAARSPLAAYRIAAIVASNEHTLCLLTALCLPSFEYAFHLRSSLSLVYISKELKK